MCEQKKEHRKVKIELEVGFFSDMGECLKVFCPDCKEYLIIPTRHIRQLFLMSAPKIEGVV